MSTASLFQNRLLFVSSKQVIKDTGFLITRATDRMTPSFSEICIKDC